MAKNRLGCFLISLFLLFVLILAGIIFLEMGSSWYLRTHPSSAAPEIVVCHLDYYPMLEGKQSLLAELVEKHRNGESLTDEDLNRAAVLAPQEDMRGLNGILCNGMIIVSSRLQGSARLYIIRHELEHLFQMEGLKPDCQDWELCATWTAALEYPRGFGLAIISSLIEAYRNSPSIWEFLFSSWYVFKVYLLP
jgi:hypothetical protein